MAGGKSGNSKLVPAVPGHTNIVDVRGEKVLLDRDVAELFSVDVRTLNQQVSRNQEKFGGDFAFRLSWEEFSELRSQNVILAGWQKVTYPPMAFTEYGIVMAATVLRSAEAMRATRVIVSTFIEVRRATWEEEAARHFGANQLPLTLDAPTRQGLTTKLNMALGHVLDAIADPEQQRAAKKEAKAVAAEGIKALKEYLKGKGVSNEKTLAEVQRIMAEAENIQVDTARKRTENEHRQLALLAKKLKLIIQAQHFADTGSAHGLLAVLSDIERD